MNPKVLFINQERTKLRGNMDVSESQLTVSGELPSAEGGPHGADPLEPASSTIVILTGLGGALEPASSTIVILTGLGGACGSNSVSL